MTIYMHSLNSQPFLGCPPPSQLQAKPKTKRFTDCRSWSPPSRCRSCLSCAYGSDLRPKPGAVLTTTMQSALAHWPLKHTTTDTNSIDGAAMIFNAKFQYSRRFIRVPRGFPTPWGMGSRAAPTFTNTGGANNMYIQTMDQRHE